jgi:Domain of unknown function (DUF4260)
VRLDRLPHLIVRLEGLFAFGGAIVLYLDADYSILALVLLILTPDLSFLGFLAGPRKGSIVYNAVHTYVVPIALGVAGLVGDHDVAVQVALIWIAHIGIDRALGYGLKYPTEFKDTHLHRV